MSENLVIDDLKKLINQQNEIITTVKYPPEHSNVIFFKCLNTKDNKDVKSSEEFPEFHNLILQYIPNVTKQKNFAFVRGFDYYYDIGCLFYRFEQNFTSEQITSFATLIIDSFNNGLLQNQMVLIVASINRKKTFTQKNIDDFKISLIKKLSIAKEHIDWNDCLSNQWKLMVFRSELNNIKEWILPDRNSTDVFNYINLKIYEVIKYTLFNQIKYLLAGQLEKELMNEQLYNNLSFFQKITNYTIPIQKRSIKAHNIYIINLINNNNNINNIINETLLKKFLKWQQEKCQINRTNSTQLLTHKLLKTHQCHFALNQAFIIFKSVNNSNGLIDQSLHEEILLKIPGTLVIVYIAQKDENLNKLYSQLESLKSTGIIILSSSQDFLSDWRLEILFQRIIHCLISNEIHYKRYFTQEIQQFNNPKLIVKWIEKIKNSFMF